jgi:hypothetical protein
MSSFAWFCFNAAITIFWIVMAIATGNAFLAIGSGIWIAILFLIDLPESSSSDSADDHGWL